MRAHRHNLTFPVFSKYKVTVIFTADIPKACAKLGMTATPDEAAVTITEEGTKRAYAVFAMRPDADTVAHESYHVISAMLKWAGATPDEETVAYHLGYLVKHITEWSK